MILFPKLGKSEAAASGFVEVIQFILLSVIYDNC